MRKFFRIINSPIVQLPWLFLLLIVPIVLWILPSGAFDNTGIEMCPSKFIFDFECFGCGLTRAVMHLHHFEIEEALYYNMLVFIVYPLLIALWVYWVYMAYKRGFNKMNTVISENIAKA